METQRSAYRIFYSALCILLSATLIDSSFHASCLLFATASIEPSSRTFSRGGSFVSDLSASSAVNSATCNTTTANKNDGTVSSHVLDSYASSLMVPKGGNLNSAPDSTDHDAEVDSDKQIQQDKKKGGPLKILFMSADTGGGHRASAESLASQFQQYYPGSEYDLVDVWTPTGVFPFKTLVPAYIQMSANPKQWWFFYHSTNTFISEFMSDIYTKLTCYRKIKRQMEQYDPDVVISVHPTMNMLPMRVSRKIAKERGKYTPYFTVVTDFGSGHCTWFTRRVDKMYIASDRIRKLARRRGLIPNNKLVMSGLPIRHDFAVQAKNMGERHSEGGKEYRETMKKNLGLDPKKKNILLMGGGEGVGSLAAITEALYKMLRKQGVDATICVVCGRNEQLKEEITAKNWDALDTKIKLTKRQRAKRFLRKIIGRRSKDNQTETGNCLKGNIDVVGLGFVTNMAEYMVATDVLVSKAGPGTIAEAAALGLPVMITSFLPGQEAGNVDIVLEGGFGKFHKYPSEIAETVADWLDDSVLLEKMSYNSAKMGNPDAASEIVKDIGSITHEWLEKNKSTK